MRRKLRFIFSSCLRVFVFSFLSFPAVAETTQPAIDPQLLTSLQAIDAKVARVKDLTAAFEQKKFSPLLKKPLISKGTIYARNTAMLWDTTTPEPTRMRIDGSSLQIYYPSQKRVEQYPIKGKLAAMAANPLPRLDAMLEQFNITAAPAPQPADSKPTLHLVLTPKQDELKQYVKEVHVSIDTDSGLADHFEILDPDGERTEITFSNQKADTGVTDDALKLNAPPGTETVQPLGPVQ